MKTWLIAASAIGGIFALGIIRLSAIILKKNMGTDSMHEYIEREALKERFRKRIKWLEKDMHDQYSLGLFHGCEYDADLINEPPASDVAPVRHGHWISLTECANEGVYCSICKKKVWKSDYAWCSKKSRNKLRSNYCPNCGALMDLEG